MVSRVACARDLRCSRSRSRAAHRRRSMRAGFAACASSPCRQHAAERRPPRGNPKGSHRMDRCVAAHVKHADGQMGRGRPAVHVGEHVPRVVRPISRPSGTRQGPRFCAPPRTASQTSNLAASDAARITRYPFAAAAPACRAVLGVAEPARHRSRRRQTTPAPAQCAPR